MKNMIQFLVSVGSIFLMAIAIFIYGKHSGKKEGENEQRKKIIEGIEKRHKVDNAVNNMSNTALDNELLDDNTDK